MSPPNFRADNPLKYCTVLEESILNIMSAQQLAAACKAKGNAAFSQKDFRTAITHYTEAIGHDGTQHALYRSFVLFVLFGC